MEIKENINLKNYSTFKIGKNSKYFIEVKNKEDIVSAVNFSKKKGLRIYILGGGSNTIFSDQDFEGAILKIEIKGFEILDAVENHTVIKVGAGENWDKIVEKTVDMGLAGFEHMSLIPGTVGATPVQNVEAYRQETSSSFVELEAYDLKEDIFVILKKDDCGFGYRTSIFKTTEKNRYIISSVTYRLINTHGEPIKVDAEVEKFFKERNILNPKLKDIRQAVINIRNAKLYDPKKVPNCGSFFENIIIDKNKFSLLKEKFSDMPYFEISDDEVKIPTGWLIQNSEIGNTSDARGYGYKDLMISDKHALTILNPDAKATFEDLQEFIQMIINCVKEKFDIEIEPEPNLVY